ncbi:hypothetical protein SEA_LEGO_52 [Arthrobacter phage Lego]|nr:hypothetical protein SEA_LEGO_52 [Arthrobacter phage Lego]
MTSFTHTDSYGDSLVVESDSNGAAVSSENGNAVYVPKDDAPAVALAVLTAAGWEGRALTPERPEAAAYVLQRHVEDAAAVKAKAEAEANLAKEALYLLNAACDTCFVDFPNETVRETWLRAARRAREIHS